MGWTVTVTAIVHWVNELWDLVGAIFISIYWLYLISKHSFLFHSMCFYIAF